MHVPAHRLIMNVNGLAGAQVSLLIRTLSTKLEKLLPLRSNRIVTKVEVGSIAPKLPKTSLWNWPGPSENTRAPGETVVEPGATMLLSQAISASPTLPSALVTPPALVSPQRAAADDIARPGGAAEAERRIEPRAGKAGRGNGIVPIGHGTDSHSPGGLQCPIFCGQSLWR